MFWNTLIEEHAHASARMGWARLLKRVFNIDLEHCPQCGGEFKIIAAIEEPAVTVRIRTTSACLPAHRRAHQPGRWRSSKRPDPQDKNGSAMGLTIPDDPARPALA